MNLPEATRQAHSRIQPYVSETPLEHSPAFSQLSGAEVWLKLENLQHTGSFKVRGAMNKLLSLSPAQLAAGVVTASSGNHGAGVAFGLSKLGAKGVVFVPAGASETKLEAIRLYGAGIQTYGTTGDDTEIFARRYAETNQMVYISPYNDFEVIAGQGTIGLEMGQQLESNSVPDVVFVTVGGGGLISGIAAYLKSVSPKIQIVGCQPENDAAMLASIRAGKIVEIEAKPTLSDGSAGGLEPGSITFELCQNWVDRWVTVSETEIRNAVRHYINTYQQPIEGAAGVALAGLIKQGTQYSGARATVVVCGQNISPQKLYDLVGTFPV